MLPGQQRGPHPARLGGAVGRGAERARTLAAAAPTASSAARSVPTRVAASSSRDSQGRPARRARPGAVNGWLRTSYGVPSAVAAAGRRARTSGVRRRAARRRRRRPRRSNAAQQRRRQGLGRRRVVGVERRPRPGRPGARSDRLEQQRHHLGDGRRASVGQVDPGVEGLRRRRRGEGQQHHRVRGVEAEDAGDDGEQVVGVRGAECGRCRHGPHRHRGRRRRAAVRPTACGGGPPRPGLWTERGSSAVVSGPWGRHEGGTMRTDAADPPRRPGRVLRRGRAARQAVAARQAGRRRRRRRPRRGGDRVLRGPRLRGALGDVDRARRGRAARTRRSSTGRFDAYRETSRAVMALLARAVARWSSRCRSTRRSSTSQPPDLPDLDVDGVTAVRRRAQGAASREVTGGLTALGRHRHLQARRQDRQRPRQARRPGRRRRRAPSRTCCARCRSTVIPGVGPATAERLRRVGVHTVAELERLSEDELVRLRRAGPRHGALPAGPGRRRPARRGRAGDEVGQRRGHLRAPTSSTGGCWRGCSTGRPARSPSGCARHGCRAAR